MRIRDAFTLRDFRDEAHVAMLSSTSYPMLNEAMKRQRIARRVYLELAGFLGFAAIVASTDLIATVPRTIGETLARTGTIRVFACPVKLPTFSVKQYWHARYHRDPGHRWLRACCGDHDIQQTPRFIEPALRENGRRPWADACNDDPL